MLKKHLKLEHICITEINTSVTLWEDPPQANGMDMDLDPAAPVSWETCLKAWILKYMRTIQGEVHNSPLVIRTAIMDSPMTADTEHYILLDDNDSLNTYAGTLYHFLLTIDSTAYLNHSEELDIELIHKLFLPLCYHHKAPSKWNNLMECLMGLYALQDQGRFIDPSINIQLFARMKYHI
ncbi:hypothetical protein M422DRAFT_249554 [Sphaerobolus stellatus SS14]|uniref:Uncharacterized protein n=1 Tax=Sphaerobolus stellatus (strain SS14) TaxID=990650 RepID=A0A0C9VUX1_SPHS4|nr:hypothetical protein M422DRAFT_249554 [Sphaerobolus stellatus SS14]